MSKADDLRKKMSSRGAAVPAFTPRPSVNVQPIPQPQQEEKPAPKVTQKPKKAFKNPLTQSSEKKSLPQEVELVALFAKVPKEDKRWLDHYRIDEGKDLGEIVSEAIQLLKSKVESQK